jgi:PAS domain S-box-containing protein
MKATLHILHLEDNPSDAELVALQLRRNGIDARMECVQNQNDFAAALEQDSLDLILSDFTLPGFDGLAALALAREKRPNIPFLFVSGTIGEEVAIDALKSGATDYVLKQRLARLVPAVRRALADAQEHAALRRAEESMVESEFKYRQLFECLSEAALLVDEKTRRVLDANRQAEILFGRLRSELMGMDQDRLQTVATLDEYHRRLAETGPAATRIEFEGEALLRDGTPVPVMLSAAPLMLYGRRLILELYLDITDRKRAEAEIQKLKEQIAHSAA